MLVCENRYFFSFFTESSEEATLIASSIKHRIMNSILIICIILLAFCIWDEMFNNNNGKPSI